jgi:hypothetical protein
MRKFLVLLLALPLIAGCTSAPLATDLSSDCAGVSVFVNFSGESQNIAKCVTFSGESELTKTILEAASVITEGTATYGDQVVCRVNNVPSADEPLEVEGNDPHLETCQDMPPAFAYWALWVKKSGSSEWEYATEGVGSLQLSAGDSVGLAFSLAGQTPTPEGK